MRNNLNKLLKSLLIVYICTVVLVVLSILVYHSTNLTPVSNLRSNINNNQPKSTTPTQLTPETTIKGVVRTTGIDQLTKQQENLIYSDYQVIVSDTGSMNNVSQNTSYFIEDDSTIAEFVGKCVSVMGEQKRLNDLEYSETQPVYALTDVYFEKLDLDQCSPYSDEGMTDPTALEQEIITLQAKINNATRISYDIANDYMLVGNSATLREKEQTAKLNGMPGVYALPSKNSVWRTIENNPNKTFMLKGYFTMGYAESEMYVIDEAEVTN